MRKMRLVALPSLSATLAEAKSAYTYYGCYGGRYFWADTDEIGHVTVLMILGPCDHTSINQAWLTTGSALVPTNAPTDGNIEQALSNADVNNFRLLTDSEEDQDLQEFILQNAPTEKTYVNMDNINPEMVQFLKVQ